MKIKKLLGILILVAIFMVSLVGCGKSEMLSLKVNKNEKYKITTTVNQLMMISFADKNNASKIIIPDVQIEEDMTTAYICDIADVDKEGTVTIKVKYDFISTNVTSAGKTVATDTRDENWKNTAEGKAYSEILKDGFTVKVNKDGKVLSVDGVNEMLDKAINSMEATSAEKDSLAALMKQNFGEEAIKDSFNRMTDIYPNEEIKPGLVWKTEQKDNRGMAMAISTNWKIKEVKDGFVTAETDSVITGDTKDNPLDVMGIKMNINIKGNEKGNVKISTNNGLMLNGEFKQKASGTMDMTLQNLGIMPNQNMSVPVTIDSTIKYQTEKVK